MLETILIIFTSMEPDVPPMLQEVVVSSRKACEQLVKDTTKWEGIAVTARCEARLKPEVVHTT